MAKNQYVAIRIQVSGKTIEVAGLGQSARGTRFVRSVVRVNIDGLDRKGRHQAIAQAVSDLYPDAAA